MSEIPEQPSPSLLHVSPLEHVKRAPWVDIGLVTGAVALTIIGGLAHFGILHHIGSLSQTAIQEAAFGGAGGLFFIEAAQRIIRNYLRKQVQPIDLGTMKPEKYSYKGSGYTVNGKIPKHYHEEIPKALKRAAEASKEREIPLKQAIAEEIDALAFEKGTISVWKGEELFFSGEYRKGWRLRYDQKNPPLTILGSFPVYDDEEIFNKLSEAKQTEEKIKEEKIKEVLDAYFKLHLASGKIKVQFGDQVLIREYELGEPVKQPLSNEFDYYIYGVDKHIYFYGLPDQIIKRNDFLIYPIRKDLKEQVINALDHAYWEEKLTGTITFQIENEKLVTVTYANGIREK